MIGFVLSELLLRALGSLYLAETRRDAAAGPGRALLCLGDSHVFGLYERAESSYPAQLQTLLDAHASEPWRVVNRGRPGANSLQVALAIEEELERTDPAAVLVTVGANDAWSYTGSGAELPRFPWYEELRWTKLLRLVAVRLGLGARAAEPDLATRAEGRNPTFRAGLQRDLAYVRERCSARGARLFLVAYVAGHPACRQANEVFLDLAAGGELVLIDASEDVAAVAGELGFERVFHLDQHPREPGYACVAAAAYDALCASGVVSGAPADRAARSSPSTAGAALRLVGRLGAPPGTADEPFLELAGGRPGARVRVFLFGLRSPGEAAPVDLAGLAGDRLLALSLTRPELELTLNSEGRGRAGLAQMIDASQAPSYAGKLVQASYLELGPGAATQIAFVPPSVTLELP